MRESRFTEQQIIPMIREHDAGVSMADLCRRHGLSEATFYKYKAKFGGMTVSDAQKLRTLEQENGRLRRLLAAAMLSSAGLDPDPTTRKKGERTLRINGPEQGSGSLTLPMLSA